MKKDCNVGFDNLNVLYEAMINAFDIDYQCE